jgi:hypothetical protein
VFLLTPVHGLYVVWDLLQDMEKVIRSSLRISTRVE